MIDAQPLKLQVNRGKTVSLRCKPYIQPFERILALAELRGLLGQSVPELLTDPAADNVVVEGADLELLKRRLTYWEAIEVGGDIYMPDQVRFELSDEPVAQAAFEHVGALPVPRRRKLRYGAHDLHEYRGKFFPQLVRSIINTVGLPAGSVILDSTCGSGTTNVEARALGMVGLGADLNPLSVLISKVKTSVFSMDERHLLSIRDTFLPQLSANSVGAHKLNARWQERDLRYLQSWFDPRALDELDHLLTYIEAWPDALTRDLLRVCLSNIVRSVSWQHDDDLRVRKQIVPYEPGRVIQAFTQETTRQIGKLVPYLSVRPDIAATTEYRLAEGDARGLTALFPEFVGKCDLLITSPPYATALPYIDTDRLSLIVLNLLHRVDHRSREYEMVGNREVLESQRLHLWDTYQQRQHELPSAVVALVDRLAEANHKDGIGFRRRNLPALLSKYFLDMLDVMANTRHMMKPGAYGFYVVGNNSTNLPEERLEITTDSLLWDIGEASGWTQVKRLSMEMLHSRDIFRKNRGSAESILVFKAHTKRSPIYGGFHAAEVESSEWDFPDADTQEHLHAIHPYPARFIPQIPRKAILDYSSPDGLVLDPFCGSGTTLLEASLLGRESIGIDNNAVACLVSRAKVACYSTDDISALQDFQQNLPETRSLDVQLSKVDIPLYQERDAWFVPEALLDLGYIREQIRSLCEPAALLTMATLSSIIVRVSHQDSDTRYARVKKQYVPGSALKLYKQRLGQAITSALEISGSTRAASVVHLGDARQIPFVQSSSVDLIVTSPPYLNAYDYHKYHRHRIHWIDGDVKHARDLEIGKHDTFTKPRAVAEPYFVDMQKCFDEWARVVKPNGKVVILIGDAIVSGMPVPVGDRFVDIMRNVGFNLERQWIRNIKVSRKSFNRSARMQREHVLLFER